MNGNNCRPLGKVEQTPEEPLKVDGGVRLIHVVDGHLWCGGKVSTPFFVPRNAGSTDLDKDNVDLVLLHEVFKARREEVRPDRGDTAVGDGVV